MKIFYVEKEKKEPKLPKVGQAWCHSKNTDIYMRISDADGRKIISNLPGPEIFSVCLKDGRVVHTSIYPNVGIILLSPVGGEIHFEEAKE
jgi:hypothetical protein